MHVHLCKTQVTKYGEPPKTRQGIFNLKWAEIKFQKQFTVSSSWRVWVSEWVKVRWGGWEWGWRIITINEVWKSGRETEKISIDSRSSQGSTVNVPVNNTERVQLRWYLRLWLNATESAQRLSNRWHRHHQSAQSVIQIGQCFFSREGGEQHFFSLNTCQKP